MTNPLEMKRPFVKHSECETVLKERVTELEKDKEELIKSLGEMLDAHEKGCRFVRGCCQNHYDLTGDGNCYVGNAFKLLERLS